MSSLPPFLRCPNCGSADMMKNGTTRRGKQKYKCRIRLWRGKVLPSQRHCAVRQETGLTSDIERFNNTLRQRVSRLGRQTYSFSKKRANHISAIWHFIHDYNEQIR